MDHDLLLILLIAIASIAGALLVLVPVLPASLTPVVAALVSGAIIGWGSLGWWFWIVQAVLVGASMLVDNVVQALGVQRVGGTKTAMLGGAIGVVAGPFLLAPFIGPFALLLGPPVGAVAGTLLGEALARSRASSTEQLPHLELEAGVAPMRHVHYARVGRGAFIAWLVSMPIKLVLLTLQLALLALAVW